MPVQVFGKEDIETVLLANPDLRFATTFLSNRYRKYAVEGESLMDKATGEIFTKRPGDGKVVSFYQNKKYMHDLMMELKVLLANNPNFLYPDASHEEAFYASTDYDIMAVYGNRENDITVEDTNLNPGYLDRIVKFNISDLSNGFFCRLTSRDADKVAINWLTNQYDISVKNYDGRDPAWIAELEKFDKIPQWDDCNAVLTYKLRIVNKDGRDSEYTYTEYIHINEEHSVIIPDTTVNKYYDQGGEVTIQIMNITYPKIQFMLAHMTDAQEKIYKQLACPDEKILMTYLNVMSFIDGTEDINLIGDEFIIALVDMPYCASYLNKIGNLVNDSCAKLILSPRRPSDVVWLEGGIWAEEVRNVYAGGVTINKESETLVKELERFISNVTIPYENPFGSKIQDVEYVDVYEDQVAEDGDDFILLLNKNNFVINPSKSDKTYNMSIIERMYMEVADKNVIKNGSNTIVILNDGNAGVPGTSLKNLDLIINKEV